MTPARELTCREMVELVTEYLDDRMAPADRERFDAHLAVCDGCRAYVEQFRLTLTALGELPEEHLSGGVQAALMDAFQDWHAARA